MSKRFTLSIALVFVFVLSTASVTFAGSNDATVYVVHGIPGQDLGLDPALPVDISVDGACVLQYFTFGEIFGPASMPAGSYSIAIHLADSENPCDGPIAIGPVTVPFMAGENATVIAHLTESGEPTASKFVNDVSPVGRGKARIIAQHTAAAPTVDVLISRNPESPKAPRLMIPDFSNGDQAAGQIRPGVWYVSISPAGSDNPVFGPLMIELAPKNTYLVYAVGSVDSGSFTLLVKPVPTSYNSILSAPTVSR